MSSDGNHEEYVKCVNDMAINYANIMYGLDRATYDLSFIIYLPLALLSMPLLSMLFYVEVSNRVSPI